MTFLELVQKAARKSSSKIQAPTTVVGQTGASFNFVEWVQDAWKNIQLERLGLGWRVSKDQTLSLVASIKAYGMPSGMESINTRSLKIHLAGAEEGNLCFQSYDYYLRHVERETMQEDRPQYFTISPFDSNLIFWPVPDDAYTVKYDGIRDVEIFDYEDTAGAGTSDLLTPTGLPSAYHDAIVWEAVRYYALDKEDGTKLAESQAMFKPYKKYFEERHMPLVGVDTTALYTRHV